MDQEFLRASALTEARRAYEFMQQRGNETVAALNAAAEVAPDVLAVAGLDRRFVSADDALPRAPTPVELAALGGQPLIGAYRPDGTVQRVTWDRSTNAWLPSGSRLAAEPTTAPAVRLDSYPLAYGDTANNYVHVMAAAQEAAERGVPLVWPDKTVLVTPGGPNNTLTLPSNLQLQATSRSKLLLRRTTAQNASAHNPRLLVVGVGTRITGLTVGEFREDGQPLIRNGYYGPITFEQATFASLTDVEVESSSGTAVHALQSRIINITGGYLHHTMADGIHLSFGTQDVNITGVTIQANDDDCIGINSHGWGLSGVDLVRRVNVSNCNLGFTRSGPGLNNIGSGVCIAGGVDVTVTGGTITNCGTAGIRVIGLTEHSGEADLFAPAARVSISNVTVLRCGYSSFAGNAYDGVYLGNCRDVSITDCRFFLCKRSGVYLTGAAINITIQGNTIVGGDENGIFIAPQKSTSAYMRQMWTSAEYADGTPDPGYVSMHRIRIEGNTIVNPALGGVLIVTTPDTPLDDLIVRGNHVAGGGNGSTAAYAIGQSGGLTNARVSRLSNTRSGGNHASTWSVGAGVATGDGYVLMPTQNALTGRPYTLQEAPHVGYEDAGRDLADGITPPAQYTDGGWVGWRHPSIGPSVTISSDLGAPAQVQQVRVYALAAPEAGISAPDRYAVQGLVAGGAWTTLADVGGQPNATGWVSLPCGGGLAEQLRVVAYGRAGSEFSFLGELEFNVRYELAVQA